MNKIRRHRKPCCLIAEAMKFPNSWSGEEKVSGKLL